MGTGIGCSCLSICTSHEMIINEMFSLMPLRQMDLAQVIKLIKQSQITKQTDNDDEQFRLISQTRFQQLFNLYGVYEDKKQFYHDYWSQVLIYFSKKRSLHITIQLCLLSKFTVNDESVDNFIEITQKLYELTTSNNEINIVGIDLLDIISKYIVSISFLAIEPFSKAKSENLEIINYLQKIWNQDKIYAFVAKKYLNNIENLYAKIDIKSFFKTNLESLSDDVGLRKSLSNFIYNKELIF